MAFLELEGRLHMISGQREGGRCRLIGVDLEEECNEKEASGHLNWQLA